MDEVGYDQYIFVDPNALENYICVICQGVLKNPVSCPQGCELCKSCTLNYIAVDNKKKKSKGGMVSCPNCNSGKIAKECLHLCRRSRQFIEECPTKCVNSENEFPCQWQGTVLNYEEHIANCPMETSKCAAFDVKCCFDGCNGIILRRDRELHFEVTLPRVIGKVQELSMQVDVLMSANNALHNDLRARDVEMNALKEEIAELKAEVERERLLKDTSPTQQNQIIILSEPMEVAANTDADWSNSDVAANINSNSGHSNSSSAKRSVSAVDDVVPVIKKRRRTREGAWREQRDQIRSIKMARIYESLARHGYDVSNWETSNTNTSVSCISNDELVWTSEGEDYLASAVEGKFDELSDLSELSALAWRKVACIVTFRWEQVTAEECKEHWSVLSQRRSVMSTTVA